MKLKKLSVLSMALIMTTAVGCSSKGDNSGTDPNADYINGSPKSITFDWQPVYEEKLRSFMNTEDYSSSGSSSSMFDLRDISGDGIPELIISPNSDHTTSCEIYTAENGSLVSLGKMGSDGLFTWLPQLNVISSEYVGDGLVIGRYYTIENNVATVVMEYTDNSGSASRGVEISHEINGEDVTLPEFDKTLEPYRTAKSLSLGRKYSFGEEAISYALYSSEGWGAVLTQKQKELFRTELTNLLSYADNADAAFELCDLNNDEIPELIVSYGTYTGAVCSIFHISEQKLNNLSESGFGSNGLLSFDLEKLIMYSDGEQSSKKCWSITDADLTNFTASSSTMECGRKYILDETSITAALR